MTKELKDVRMIDRLMRIYPKRDISESLIALVTGMIYEERLEMLGLSNAEIKQEMGLMGRSINSAGVDRESYEYWSKRLNALQEEVYDRYDLSREQQQVRKDRIFKEAKQSVWEEIERRLEKVEAGKPVEDGG